jgi:hypothetical protein
MPIQEGRGRKERFGDPSRRCRRRQTRAPCELLTAVDWMDVRTSTDCPFYVLYSFNHDHRLFLITDASTNDRGRRPRPTTMMASSDPPRPGVDTSHALQKEGKRAAALRTVLSRSLEKTIQTCSSVSPPPRARTPSCHPSMLGVLRLLTR